MAHPPGANPSSIGRSIGGTIEFKDVRRSADDVTVYVRVQETGRADAPATSVAQAVLKSVKIPAGSSSLPFTVEGVPVDPKARYVVRVHVDVDGDGAVTRGDYVSTQSHPVGGAHLPLAIVVRQV